MWEWTSAFGTHFILLDTGFWFKSRYKKRKF